MANKKKHISVLERIMILIILVLALILGSMIVKREEKAEAAKTTPSPTAAPTVIPTPTPEPTIDPAVFTDTDSFLLLANKKHKLPDGYEPDDLVDANEYGGHGTIAPMMRREAAEMLGKMTEAAEKDGVNLTFSSAYRSEAYQKQLYDGYAAEYGTARADRISSRPGYSDHQTGLALDFIEGGDSDFIDAFEDTESGKWLYAHAHEYGFILRYPKGKESITGYAYEPWHYRYVGKEYAEKIYAVSPDESFEEYFKVEGGDYMDAEETQKAD